MNAYDYIIREREIQQAVEEYPGKELMEAYTMWKTARGQKATWLSTGDPSIDHSRMALKEASKKPCIQQGCNGMMVLEAICGSCVEGRKGYKSKWVCEECLHRELSKKGYLDWLQELSNENYV